MSTTLDEGPSLLLLLTPLLQLTIPTVTPAPPAYSEETASAAPEKPRVYKTSVPLYQLSRYPAPVDCPVCGQRRMTKVKMIVGGYTQYVSILPSPYSLLHSI